MRLFLAAALSAGLPLAAGLPLIACDDGGSTPDAAPRPDAATSADAAMAFSSLSLTWEAEPAAEGAAGEALDLVAVVSTPAGPAAGLSLDVVVERGGGSAAATVVTDAAGRAGIGWTLGVAPVQNRLRATVGAGSVVAVVDAVRATPLGSDGFGGVDARLTELGVEGSTEDLAFDTDGAIVLGVPGGLLRLDAAGEGDLLPTHGDALVAPLGVAYDRAGNLWVADGKGLALRRVSPDGEVTTALTEVDGAPLEGPNYVAVGPDGHVYLSDPCRGLIARYDPAAGAVVATQAFDLPTEGGPNGLAFDAEGALWLATENTVLTCRHTGIAALDAPLAGLFRVPITADGFGPHEAVEAGLGVFGDGVAIDAEGNIYAIFDGVVGLQLSESAVWVRRAEGGPMSRLAVADGAIYANLAFGTAPFGETSIYLSLLAIPPFTPASARGVQRVEVGLPGRPLLP